jgi:hypothetical protein
VKADSKKDVKKDTKKDDSKSDLEEDGEPEDDEEEDEVEEDEDEEEAVDGKSETKDDKKKPAETKSSKPDAAKKPAAAVAVTKNGNKKPATDGNDDAEPEEDGSLARTLGEITAIDAGITNNKTEVLSTLHTICYDNPGKTNTIKKNLRKFIGFEFDADSDDYKKRLEATQKIDINKLKVTCDILKLDNKGTKEQLGERICTFLLKPEGDNEPEDEEPEEPEPEEDQDPESEEVISEEEVKPKKKAAASRSRGGGGNEKESRTGGRPKRATAARSFNRGEI